MLKVEFISALRKRLTGLPPREVEERIIFYSEMIDDRIEEGKSEEEAVSELGNVEELAKKILAETPIMHIVKERVKPKRALSTVELLLIVLGSPIWLSLLAALIAVIVGIFAVLLSVFASLWAVDLSLAALGVGGVVGFIGLLFEGAFVSGLMLLGAGVLSAGASILLFFVCKAITVMLGKSIKRLVLWIKGRLVKRGENK